MEVGHCLNVARCELHLDVAADLLDIFKRLQFVECLFEGRRLAGKNATSDALERFPFFQLAFVFLQSDIMYRLVRDFRLLYSAFGGFAISSARPFIRSQKSRLVLCFPLTLRSFELV